MELTAGLSSVDDYIRYIEAGADECLRLHSMHGTESTGRFCP